MLICHYESSLSKSNDEMLFFLKKIKYLPNIWLAKFGWKIQIDQSQKLPNLASTNGQIDITLFFRSLWPLQNTTLNILKRCSLNYFLLYLNANSATPASWLREARGIFFMAQSWSFYSQGHHLRKKKIMSDYGFNRVPWLLLPACN